MSTRSNIAIKRKNGTVESVYCHWDGYLSHNGKILLKYYQDTDKINKLIDLGDISSLNKEVEPTKEHTYDNPQEGVTVAYKRDRGEDNADKRVWKSLKEYLENVETLFIEYIYVYDEEKQAWFYTTTNDEHSLSKLTEDNVRG